MSLNATISPSSESVFATRKNSTIANADSTAAKLAAVNGIAPYLASFATPKFTYLNTLPALSSTAKEKYNTHTDHLGSSAWVTDSLGVAVQHLAYMPWGESWVTQKTGNFNPTYTFSGKERDEETGYSYFGARFYDSDHSFWLSVDPMRGKYPSLSPFVYCANNPLRLVDPNGETIVIAGNEDAAQEAFAQLQSATSLKLYRDSNGKIGIEGGKAKRIRDKLLMKAINDKSITVNINAVDGTYDDYINGGSFMGTKITNEFDGIDNINSAKPYSSFQSILYPKEINTFQDVDPYEMGVIDKIGLRCVETEDGKLEYTKSYRGQTMIHEVTESYKGGMYSMMTRKSLKNARESIKEYKIIHRMATKQPILNVRDTYELQSIFKRELGR